MNRCGWIGGEQETPDGRQTDGLTVAVDGASGRGCRSAGAGRVEDNDDGEQGDDGIAGPEDEAVPAAGGRRRARPGDGVDHDSPCGLCVQWVKEQWYDVKSGVSHGV